MQDVSRMDEVMDAIKDIKRRIQLAKDTYEDPQVISTLYGDLLATRMALETEVELYLNTSKGNS